MATGRRAFALGLLGAAAEGGGVLGPLWGAAIISVADWRWIFWLNMPLGLLILAALVWRTARHPRYPGRIDWLGAALLGGALLALTLGLSSSSSNSALAGLGGLGAGAGRGSPDLADARRCSSLAAAPGRRLRLVGAARARCRCCRRACSAARPSPWPTS